MSEVSDKMRLEVDFDVFVEGGCPTCGHGAVRHMSEEAFAELCAAMDKWAEEVFPKWRPIETAPEGTHEGILVYCPDLGMETRIAHWGYDRGTYRWVIHGLEEATECECGEDPSPKFWMPLPASPYARSRS